MITINHVVKQYGGYTAVDGLCLELKEGEIYGLLGPNGAGKTTTIKMIMGLLKPTSGTIRIAGYDIQKEPIPAKKMISYVPDRAYLYEKLTAWEFLRFIAGLYELDDQTLKDRGQELLKLFELEKWQDELIGNFSHGMKQRLCMASAFLRKPKILILDEPTVGLDPKGARLLREMMQSSRDHGMTIMMSTHILEIAEKMCDRMGIILKGRLIAEGTSEEIRRQASMSGRGLEDVFLHLTGGEETADLIKIL
ncbi:MAG: ABC transporter [Nitrospirae bacterium CG_4_10_14_3_um_filter_53_41]|nr:MAG: ABC transporter [Nitrospirae bacterium CG_4_10_14_3_um_filter_53_41]